MNKKIESLFTIITLSLITLLTGCNSEGAFNSTGTTKPDEGATLVEIAISPSPVFIAHRNNQQLTAIGKYDDGTEVDITNSAEWQIIGDPTIVTLSSTGLVTAGTTLDSVKVVASKAGIFSEEVTVTVSDLAGPVIDIFDTGSGTLFTNAPSKAYLDSIGGSATDGIVTTSSNSLGPAGDFYRFYWTNANELCTTYNTLSLGGRTNWHLPTQDELLELRAALNSGGFNARDWSVRLPYWSATPEGSEYYFVSFQSGGSGIRAPDSVTLYVSCVSNPSS